MYGARENEQQDLQFRHLQCKIINQRARKIEKYRKLARSNSYVHADTNSFVTNSVVLSQDLQPITDHCAIKQDPNRHSMRPEKSSIALL